MSHWHQREIELPRFRRGLHPITDFILESVPEISKVHTGLVHLFLKHTSAALSINENADPDVLLDLDEALDHIAPENAAYRHIEEGSDDMPSHVKTSLLGCSLMVPIHQGRLCLGTWQGICLCEFRRHAAPRKLVVTVQGEKQ